MKLKSTRDVGRGRLAEGADSKNADTQRNPQLKRIQLIKFFFSSSALTKLVLYLEVGGVARSCKKMPDSGEGVINFKLDSK